MKSCCWTGTNQAPHTCCWCVLWGFGTTSSCRPSRWAGCPQPSEGSRGKRGVLGSVHNTSDAACLGLSQFLLMVHIASMWKAEMTKCCHFCVCVSIFLLLPFRPVCLILNEIPFMAMWFLLVSTFRWVRHHKCCFICSSLIPVSINSFFCYSFIHFRM